MSYVPTNIPSMGCRLRAVTTSGQKPCWNLALELPSEAAYQLHTSNFIALLSNLVQTLSIFFSCFSPCLYVLFICLFMLFSWIIKYMPLYIVYLSYKLLEE